MKFKRLATILMAAAMMVSLVACTGDNGENSETPVASGNDVVEETETNHITLAESWGFENFYTIMTPDVSASNFGITYYLSNFYDVLVEYQDGEYVGGLAEDWTISEDGTVYTFNLRHDVKFSDGSDLTAEDVAKSLLAVPINLGQYNGTYGRLSTIIEDAVVVDDYTVEMHLTQPYYNALRELCLANPFGIVSSEQLNDDLFLLVRHRVRRNLKIWRQKGAPMTQYKNILILGYDTNIGENGSKLSGGERQRISIARALLKNAPVILLDEATASMDAESETMVQTALSALLKGRTVIVIAHRMRTIANADKIVVLDKGKVTEVGTPSELAKKGGLYAHLVALQQKQQMSSLPT